ncbi:MAG TPA: ASCH domain-containing protein [Solirubrobacterales bacterium]
MKALSIRQPWAWLIVRPDLIDAEARAQAWRDRQIKDVENRNWNTRFRGVFLVHASNGMSKAEYAFAHQYAAERGVALPVPEQLQRGGVIGRVTLDEVAGESCASPWFMGRYGFLLRDASPLRFTPMKGRLGFFEVGQ